MSRVHWSQEGSGSDNQNTSVDVAIVGTGFAGLAAAIEARLAGSSVTVFEKRDFYGGNSSVSGATLAAVCPELQQPGGHVDSTRRMFDDMIRAGETNNPELVKVLCMYSREALRWLADEIGVSLLDDVEHVEGHSVTRSFCVQGQDGKSIIEPLLNRAKELGVELRLSSPVQKITTNSDRRVDAIAVGSDAPSRTTISVRQAVVLASGGFSAEAYQQSSKRRFFSVSEHSSTSLPNSTSEVLRMAEDLGAELLDMEQVELLPCASPDEPGRGVTPFFASYVLFPYGFMVDPATGKRFVNEWSDRRTCADGVLALGHPAIAIACERSIHQAGEQNYEHLDESVIKRFECLELLANTYGIPLNALEETLSQYNSALLRKRDTLFGKVFPPNAEPQEPPYFAVRIWPKVHSTLGGLRISARAEVLTSEGAAIEGLYAAGEVTGGVHGRCRLGTCAITECIVFGRIAGREAAMV